MRTLTVALAGDSYPIHIGPGLLDRADLILPHLAQPRAVIVTNDRVGPLYLDRLTRTLSGAGVRCEPIILPDGEDRKVAATLESVYDVLLERRCERKTTLIALGGGVVGDLTGFAAATYLRGVPFIQVPTTLLAQVDSSVGGKTGINHPRGKNMIGAFYQPKLVLADTDTVATLPPRELSAGLAEVVKYGILGDAAFFEWLEQNMERLRAGDQEALDHAVYQSCRDKADIVGQDEKETGVRALLNLGHTFGHAIEAGLGFGVWLHGEAVAAGMLMAADLSRRLGYLDATSVARIRVLLERAGCPVTPPDLGVERYLALMGGDKKVEGGRIRFILIRRIGEAFVTADAAPEALAATLSRAA
jgi:3-dehydroquinate synthase